MKIDYNHQRISSRPMYHSGPPPMPPMGPCPPYHHPIPPNSGMYPPLPRQPMQNPMPPQPMPPQQMPPQQMPPQQMPPRPMPPHLMPPQPLPPHSMAPQPMPQQSMPPHHPHMPPHMPPPLYPHMPPHPVHYMQPPGPLPVIQNHHTYQHMPLPPAQKPIMSLPAPPPVPPVLSAPLPPDAPPLPPLPPSELRLPPPPKEPPPPSPVKKTSIKHDTNSKSATVGLSHNHKKLSFDTHSPDAFTSTSIPTIPLTRDKTVSRSSTPMSEARHSSSPQMSVSSATTTQSLPSQSHYSSYPPMVPSTAQLNMSHPPHHPGVSGTQYYHPQPSSENTYDPDEAMFSPASSTDDSPIKEQTKHEDSLIDKYVREFSAKLPTKSAALLESEKSPSKKVSFAPDTKKESPMRIDLDSRLKMMFGGEKKSSTESNEDVQGRKKAPTKMPVHMADRGPHTIESVPVIQTASIDERPLSPPPSPFLSKEIYLYWHKETIRIRKASKHASVDFVNAGSSKAHTSYSNKSRSHESDKGFAVRANGQQGSMPPPPPPKNFLPTVPPPSYKKLSQDDNLQGHNLKADSSLKNSSTGHYHPYLRTNDRTDDSGKSVSKSSETISSVNNNSISNKKYSLHNNSTKLSSDSELELTCQNTKPNNKTEQIKPNDRIVENKNKVSVNAFDTKNVVVSESFLKAKTVGLVMSKILAELRQTIRQEIVKKLLDDNIMDTTESGIGS
ncbi:unnamed protein product [Meganyctiphanes norvegica]|uniref:Pollen-specific leucine-rich repeat extensin-like protein 1 n=1 Tax=Meganyctiphanes norvegica TaxID=48144 RepID=A0AAV2Q1T2_MEGNR